MLCYAVKNIIHPDIIPTQIPHLLALLSNIESYRQRVRTLAKDVLAWNDKQFRESGPTALTHDEENQIARVAQETTHPNNDHHRAIYRTVVLNLCELDIYHLWPRKNRDVLHRRFAEYFGHPADTPSKPVFHRGFSAPEQRELSLVHQRCSSFLKQANVWEAKRIKYFEEKGLINLAYEESEFLSYRRDFANLFPNPVDSSSLVAKIDHYIADVQKIVQHLEKILPG